MKSSLQWTVCEPLQMFYIWLSSQLVWKSFKKEQFGFFLRWLARPKVRLRRKILGFLIWDKVFYNWKLLSKKRNFKILQNHILKTTIWINQFDYYYSGFGISNHSKLDFPLQFYREIQRFEYALLWKHQQPKGYFLLQQDHCVHWKLCTYWQIGNFANKEPILFYANCY